MIELVLKASSLQELRDKLRGLHEQFNAPIPDFGYAGQKAEASAEKPKATKAPKADAAPKTTEQNAADYKAALDEPAAPLDYAKDVVSKILAKVAELQGGGLAPADAKAKVQDVIRSTFGVTNAKEVPADKWPALLEVVAKVSANG